MEKEINVIDVKCKVDAEEIDIAIKKADKLNKLLQEVNELIREIKRELI